MPRDTARTLEVAVRRILVPALLVLTLPGAKLGAADDLFSAVRAGDLVQVQRLLDAGADVNTADRYGATVLAAASVNGRLDVVRLLLERGADPNVAETFYGARPLDMALFFAEQRDVAMLLLSYGAEDRDQALAFALQGADLELAAAAIDAGPISESTLEDLAALPDSADEAVAALLARAERRPDPPPPSYTLEELNRFTGLFEGFATDLRAESVLREGRLRLRVDDGAFADLEVVGERAFRTPDESVEATFFGRAGTIEGIAVRRGEEPPVSLRRAVAEPTGAGEFTAPELADVEPTVHWPGFRGPNATGVGDGADTPVEWNLETGEHVLWSASLEGLGNSSPVVWGDRVFVTTAVADAEQELRVGLTGEGTPVEERVEHSWRVIAFDKNTGETLWETEVGLDVPLTNRHFKATQANSTPVTNGRHLAVVFPTAGLAVLDLEGEILWRRSLGGLNAGAFSDPGIEWGYASSPVIHGDRLILQVDVHDGPYLAAWDLATGDELWRVERDVAPSWATPAILAGEDGDELVVNGSWIYGYDPMTGEELWSLGPNSELVIATPVAGDGVVYVSAGYPPIKPIYAVPAGTRGALDATQDEGGERLAWSHDRGGAYMPTPLLYRGIFYVVHHNGIFVAYDAETGEALSKSRFSKRGTFTASPVAVNGKLYAATEEGQLYVLAAGTEYDELAVHDFGEPLMATPAVSEGILFVRTPSRLIALAY
jgi:outer membrane protein assembly factor BamB